MWAEELDRREQAIVRHLAHQVRDPAVALIGGVDDSVERVRSRRAVSSIVPAREKTLRV